MERHKEHLKVARHQLVEKEENARKRKEKIVKNLMACGGLWCDNDIQSVKDILSKI